MNFCKEKTEKGEILNFVLARLTCIVLNSSWLNSYQIHSISYPVPQPYCSLAFSGGYVRRRWLKVALLDPIDLWTTISISKTF